MSLVTLFDISGILLEIDPTEPSTCVLVISVGQPYYERAAFEAIIRALNISHFTKLVIVVADTLQRHTILLSGISPEEATQFTHNKGRAWVKGILKYLANLETPRAELDLDGIEPSPDSTTFAPSVTLRLPCTIKYWDSFLALPNYSGMKSFITRRYESSEKEHAHTTQKKPSFCTAINDISSSFSEAYLSSHADKPGFSYENAVALNKTYAPCLKYIMEELAVTLLFDSLSPAEEKIYIAYPHILPASKQMANICGILFHEQNKSLRFIDLRFSGVDFGLGKKPKTLKFGHQQPESEQYPTPEKPIEIAEKPEKTCPTLATSAPENSLLTGEATQSILRHAVSATEELDAAPRAKVAARSCCFTGKPPRSPKSPAKRLTLKISGRELLNCTEEETSPKANSASGRMEGVEKHLAEKTILDLGTSSRECPEEVFTPHKQQAEVRELLSRVRAIANKLNEPYCTDFAQGLLRTASQCLSRRRNSEFDFAPKNPAAPPNISITPAQNSPR